MYVGHALLAFALGATLAAGLGAARRRALAVGAVAGAFGLVPDVDMARTVLAVVAAGPTAVFPTTEHVWTRSWVVHRSLTHSLVTGTLAVGAVSLLAAGLRDRDRGDRRGAAARLLPAAGLLGAVLGLAYAADARLGIGTVGLYLAAAVGLAVVARRRGLRPRWIGLAAAVGLLSHPFGDLWMGRPPVLVYPFRSTPALETVVFAADPTVNLLALFAIEVGLAWAAVSVVAAFTDRPLRRHVRPRAALGATFAGAIFVVPPPTLDLAYQFAIGTLATGAVLGSPPILRSGIAADETDRRLTAAVTGLAGVTAALVGYLAAYLALGPP